MIRIATKEDIGAIQLIANITLSQAYSEVMSPQTQEQFTETHYSDEALIERIEKDRILVAEDDGLVHGFSIYQVREEDTRIYAIYILPKYQKQGLGKDFVKEIAKRVKKESKYLVVEIENGNKTAEAFYKNLGFELEGFSPDEVFGQPFKTIKLKRAI